MPGTDSAVLREARQRCHKARDEFFSCIEASGEAFVLGGPPPASCKKQRQAFEAACKASWVQHFDKIHDKKLRLLQTLQQNIGRTSGGLGSVQGEPQQ